MSIEEILKEMIAEEVKAQLNLIVSAAKNKAELADGTVIEKPRRRRERNPDARPAPRIITEAARKSVVTFEIGEKIQYKQGKGTFEAVITGINLETCEITFKREKTDKYDERIDVRTADKIYKLGTTVVAE